MSAPDLPVGGAPLGTCGNRNATGKPHPENDSCVGWRPLPVQGAPSEAYCKRREHNDNDGPHAERPDCIDWNWHQGAPTASPLSPDLPDDDTPPLVVSHLTAAQMESVAHIGSPVKSVKMPSPDDEDDDAEQLLLESIVRRQGDENESLRGELDEAVRLLVALDECTRFETLYADSPLRATVRRFLLGRPA